MQGNEISQCAAKEKVKETAASMVLSALEATAARAEKIACVVAEKTSSVTRQEPAQTSVRGPNVPCEIDREWPLLFGRIRELTESIGTSLSRIEYTMQRCEL